MTDIAALKALLEKVKAGTVKDNDFAQAFPSESAYGHCTWHDAHRAFLGSTDAAIAFHKAVRPEHQFMVGHVKGRGPTAVVFKVNEHFGPEHYHSSKTEARALLIADIDSIISEIDK